MYGYVYLTLNLITGRYYIGQKKSDHFLGTKYLGSGKVLRYAVQYYGKENFDVDLLETADSKEELDEKEKYWIKALDATNRIYGYNLASGGGGVGGTGSWTDERRINTSKRYTGVNNPHYGKKHTEESKMLMSINNAMHRPEIREKCSRYRKGKLCGDDNPMKRTEVNKKVSEKLKNRPKTEEHKRKISESLSRRINQYSIDGELINTYKSASDAIATFGLKDPGYIHKCCNGKRESYKGFIWRYCKNE